VNCARISKAEGSVWQSDDAASVTVGSQDRWASLLPGVHPSSEADRVDGERAEELGDGVRPAAARGVTSTTTSGADACGLVAGGSGDVWEQGPHDARSGRTAEVPRKFLAECRIRSESFVDEVRGGRRVAGTRSHGVTRYLISFDDGAMTFPEEDLPDVAKAALKVVQEAEDAGVWVFGAGLESQRATVVATDGTVTDGPYPETKEVIGGFAVLDVPSREEALDWAAKIAVACRCAQEVRELLPDPTD
jgi:hypothetical protein